jgi:hypothetical protein
MEDRHRYTSTAGFDIVYFSNGKYDDLLPLIWVCADGKLTANAQGRSDLGNSKIAGLEEDLRLTSSIYSSVASIFYAGYILFLLPGTLLMRKIGPAREAG